MAAPRSSRLSGELSGQLDPNYASIDPADGTLRTETLPGCTGASIDITMSDESGDDDYSKTLPSSDGLVIVIGE